MVYSARLLSWLSRTMLLPIIPLFVLTLLPEETTKVSTYTGLVVGVGAATGTASGVYLGRLGDRIGHRQILIASALAGAVFYSMQVLTTNVWQVLIIQAMAGAAAGGVIPSLSALLNQYTQPGQEGSAFGLDSSVGAAARTVAPLLGTGVAVWFGLSGAFVVAGGFFVLTAALAVRWLPDYKPLPKPQAA